MVDFLLNPLFWVAIFSAFVLYSIIRSIFILELPRCWWGLPLEELRALPQVNSQHLVRPWGSAGWLMGSRGSTQQPPQERQGNAAQVWG